jgi:osmotically-inducible protein OsmY
MLDQGVLQNVEDALWRQSLYRVSGRHSLGIDVSQGVVTLRGHVTSPMLLAQILNWVKAVPGVRGVVNELVADSDPTIEVAQALAHDRLTRPLPIRVGAHQGWIHLAGEVPTHEAQAGAEAVAASVARVRGVLTLPRVSGKKPAAGRRPLQPLPGQEVYASDGTAGRVSHVVINPLNRLVSHVVVNTGFALGQRVIRQQAVVPAEALLRVTDGGVFVADTLEALAARPIFQPQEFQRPGWQWVPPYPYDPGSVLWPAQPMYYILPVKPAKELAERVEAAIGA